MRNKLGIVLGICLAWTLSVRGEECLWHVTFSDPEGRTQGAASAHMFAAGTWDSLDAAETAILLGTFDVSSAVASFQLAPGTSDHLFTVPDSQYTFFEEAVYAVFSAPTPEGSAYYDLGWTNPNHGDALLSGNLVGFYVDDAGVTHPVNVAMNDVGLSRSRSLPGSVPEPDGCLLLLVGIGLLGLRQRRGVM